MQRLPFRLALALAFTAPAALWAAEPKTLHFEVKPAK